MGLPRAVMRTSWDPFAFCWPLQSPDAVTELKAAIAGAHDEPPAVGRELRIGEPIDRPAPPGQQDGPGDRGHQEASRQHGGGVGTAPAGGDVREPPWNSLLIIHPRDFDVHIGSTVLLP